MRPNAHANRASLPIAGLIALFTTLLVVPCMADEAGGDFDPRSDEIIEAALADNWTYDKLGELCDTIGPRLTASPQEYAAIAWATEVMKAEGFDRVWTEEVTVPHWIRGRESAHVLSPVACEMPILGLGRSIGTPVGGIEAEVMAVTDFEELTRRGAEAAGKIVLFDPPWKGYGFNVKYRGAGADSAATYGAVAALVRSPSSKSLATPHTGVMRYGGEVPEIPAACVTEEDAGLLHRLADRGLHPRVRLEMEARSLPDTTSYNVLGELRGRELPAEIIVVGGHLDSWDSGTGAHDDAAGCLIMLGATRLLKEMGLRPRRTIRVVLFTAEEFGGHGGRAYLEAHRDELPKHVAALESDSGAFAPRGYSVRGSESLIEHLTGLVAGLDTIGAASVTAGWAGVDIGPIVAEGVPGLGHRTHSEPYFQYHHGPADTFDKIDAEDLARNVAAAASLIYAIAEQPTSLRQFDEEASDVHE